MPVHNVYDDLVRLASIKAAVEELGAEKAEVEARLLAAYDAMGKASASTTVNGETIKGTKVAPQRVSIDEAKLKKALDAKQWGKVTTQVLSKDLLEAAVAMGEVDGNVVAAASTITDTKPYIKITGKVPGKDLGPISVINGNVTILDARGHTKPAAKRIRKPQSAR